MKFPAPFFLIIAIVCGLIAGCFLGVRSCSISPDPASEVKSTYLHFVESLQNNDFKTALYLMSYKNDSQRIANEIFAHWCASKYRIINEVHRQFPQVDIDRDDFTEHSWQHFKDELKGAKVEFKSENLATVTIDDEKSSYEDSSIFGEQPADFVKGATGWKIRQDYGPDEVIDPDSFFMQGIKGETKLNDLFYQLLRQKHFNSFDDATKAFAKLK